MQRATKLFPVFAVTDLDAALDFYQSQLGFSVAWTWGNPATRAGVSLDDIEIHLDCGVYGTSLYYQHTNFAGKWFGFIAPFGLPQVGKSNVYFVVCARKDMGSPKEVDEFLDWVLDLETQVVLDDLVNMQTIHFKPGTLTRSDLTLGRFFQYMRKFPRAHPSADFIR